MDNGFFTINGAEEIQRGLDALSRGVQNKILRPGMNKGAAEIRKKAKTLAPKKTGLLKKNISSRVITLKKGRRGLVARIGFLYVAKIQDAYYPEVARTTDRRKANRKSKEPRPVAVVGNTMNKRRNFLNSALSQASSSATQILIQRTQQKLDEHWSKY